MAKKKKKKNYSKLIIGIILVLACGFLSYRLIVYCKRSSYFTVEHFSFSGKQHDLILRKLQSIKGKNIFSIDFKKITATLRRSAPELYELRLVRQFPNTIVVDAQQRLPVVKIKISDDSFFLDKEAVVFPFAQHLDSEHIPLLKGHGYSPSKVKLGVALTRKDIVAALDVLDIVYQMAEFKEMHPSVADISDGNKISLYFSDTLEVRIGKQDQRKKLALLALLLRQPDVDVEHVKYIDLRFKEPIIGRR
ncbi:cell division protein FtsQ/DivIB [Candidatus Omnitrophota bacterium]